MISHRNIVSFLAAIWNNVTLMPKETDVYLSILPFSHIYERTIIIAMLYGGACIALLTDGSITNFN